MSLTRAEVAPSQYIDSVQPTKIDGRTIAKKAYRHAVNNQSTAYTLWLIAMKHKTGLLIVGNIILVLNWVIPAWPQIVLSVIGK